MKEGNELAFGDATELSLQIYNANAITAYGIAGTVVIELESYDAEGTLIGDKFTINVAIDRTPSQLNVTVPLVLVMKTNIDGGSVNMENSSYAIENESSMRVKLTDAKVDNMSGNTMTKVDSKAALTGVDQFYVGVTVPQTIEADGSVDANGNATDICKPITEIATSPLSFVTKEGAEYGLHMATVTYTVKIPE